MKSSNTEDKNKTFEEANEKTLKAWHAPKLVIEDTENTKGGDFSCNSPGDDAWYSS
jgi:hypothetical protein